MKTLIAITLAAVYGLITRLMFGFLDNSSQIMSVTFLFVVPLLIGFLTVLLIPTEKTTSGTAAFFKPWLTSLGLLFITLLLKVEGIICWVLLFPLFATVAGIGGLIAYHYKKSSADPAEGSDGPDWPKPNTLNVSLLFMLPVALGSLEGERAWTPEEITIQEQLTIDAPVAAVWQVLAKKHAVSQQSRPPLSSSLLGFPRHISTTLDTLAVGGKRISYYEKGLHFQEKIVRLEKERLLVFSVNTAPGQFPPTVMDEHVLIGGKHLDILDDTYQFQTLADGSTRVTLSSRFYINTPFNWYARIWANYLMSDILQGELYSVRARAMDAKRPVAFSPLHSASKRTETL
ncbi:hypothetical protein MON38_06490 [Hymenobacter sp. DH14]|uniref:SRPBCC family protein n=1 Tax=Hymenobacter cyanobacteriorum TaxID=2926463 RepID=A0A9X1VIR1_9BACT|nr:hypothetical protein [Hymenobacter cyanobacteriorum]MCI1187061.1 hypothetical protein [Hymenobacter cyanobacteriorum]